MHHLERRVRIVPAGVDMSSGVRGDTELLADRERLLALLEQAPVGILVADLDGYYTEVNDAGCRLLAMTREEILGKRITELIPAEDETRLLEAREQLLTGGVHVGRWRLQRSDGSLVPVEVSTRMLQDGRWQAILRDLSARHAAEAQQKQLQHRLDAIVSNASEAIIAMDEEHRIVVYNEGARRIFGWTAEEVLGQPHEILIPAGHRGGHRQHVRRFAGEPVASRTKEDRGQGIVGLRKSGEIFPAEAAISKAEVDGHLQYTVILRDVTERRRADEAVRLSEERLRVGLQAAPAVVCNQDLDLRYTWIAGSAPFTADEAEGRTDFDLFSRVDAERLAGLKRKVISSGRGLREVVRVTLGGATAYHDLVVEPLRDGAGEVVGITCACWDVTEQHRVEAEQRFLAEAGEILMSAATDPDVTLEAFARMAVREFADWFVVDLVSETVPVRRSVAHADPEGSDLAQLLEASRVDPRQTPLVAEALDRRGVFLVREITPEYVTSTSRRPEHAHLLQRMSGHSMIGAPLIARGRMLGAFGAISSTRRYGEREVSLVGQLAQLAALAVDNAHLHGVAQRAIAGRDEVLRVVAHDLRNPVFAAQLGIRRLSERVADAHRPIATLVSNALGQASRLIGDLLDVTRIENGGPAVSPERVASWALVDDALQAAGPMLSDATLGLEVELPAPLPDVLADRVRVGQVFSNLLGNAIKFTPPGGRIHIGGVQRGREVCFFVRDTGPGIPGEAIAHLFDRFWQGDRSDRRGVGLGLPIAKGLVEAHGGRIWAESAPGEGSAVFFTLPVAFS
jgi:PAS domain S-box-containing protein